MFPSPPRDGDRDPWGEEVSREIARSVPRSASGVYGPTPDDRPAEPQEDEEFYTGEIPFVPVRRTLSVAIAGFAGLLGVGLTLGALTTGPDSRGSFAFVIFGVQMLYVLAWSIAMRPPVLPLVASVGALSGLVSAYLAATGDSVLTLVWPAVAGVLLVVGGQFAFRVDRLGVRDALGSTLLIAAGVVTPSVLVLLTRRPAGTQAAIVCLIVAATALIVARLIDAVFPKPRIAPQVPRGATGIIVGAMVGTLAAAALGRYLVLPFTPARGAIIGLVVAGVAVLVDLAVNFTEAGRAWPDEAPTFWLARHMQGPLAAFATIGPVAYVLTVFVLS